MLTERFATKCIMNRKTVQMFTKKKTNYNMKLRHTKTYNETNAKTNRLKNSSILHMEKILNKKCKENTKILNNESISTNVPVNFN